MTANEYTTVDMCLATTLLSKGFHMTRIIPNASGMRSAFVFLDDGTVKMFVESYWRDEILVKPRDFHNAMRDLKTKMYSPDFNGSSYYSGDYYGKQ